MNRAFPAPLRGAPRLAVEPGVLPPAKFRQPSGLSPVPIRRAGQFEGEPGQFNRTPSIYGSAPSHPSLLRLGAGEWPTALLDSHPTSLGGHNPIVAET